MSFGGRDYDRTRALIDGTVVPTGVDLNYLVMDDPDYIFRRMIDWEDFDASELSLSTYCAMRAYGDSRFIAIPVFPSRRFRHSYFLCNTNSRINEPADLVGKRVGLMEWDQTAVVWMKGILQHYYDIHLEKINWVKFRQERYAKIKPKKFKIETTSDVTSTTAEDRGGEALAAGEIDALLTARIPEIFYKENSNIKRLFGNYVEAEEEYYKKTKIFPIMHTVVIRAPIHDKDPWIARSLLDAFREAKKIGYKYLEGSGDRVSLAWGRYALEKQMFVMGRDPYPYNFEDNKKVIETLIQYQIEQEIVEKSTEPETLFTRNTLGA